MMRRRKHILSDHTFKPVKLSRVPRPRPERSRLQFLGDTEAYDYGLVAGGVLSIRD